ncbi:MAG: hypothetical protein ACLQHL_15430 [Candidatus Cybelea sp.]
MPRVLILALATAAVLFVMKPAVAGASLLSILEELGRAGEATGALERDAAEVEALDHAALAAGAVAAGADLAEHTRDLSKALVVLAPDGDDLLITSNLADGADAKPPVFDLDPQKAGEVEVPISVIGVLQSFPTEQAISNAGSEELMTALQSAQTQTKYMVALDAVADGKLDHVDLTGAENVWFVDRDGKAWRQAVVDGHSMAHLNGGVVADPSVAYSPILYEALGAQPVVGVNCIVGCTGDIGTLVGVAKQQVASDNGSVADWIARIAKDGDATVALVENKSGKSTMLLAKGGSSSEFDFDKVEELGERIKDLYERGDDVKDILSSASDQSPTTSSGSGPSLWIVVLIGVGILIVGSFVVGIVKGIVSG